MQDIQVTDYLTWEYCHDPEIQYLNCSAPESVFNHMPQWFKNQKAHKEEIVLGDGRPFADKQTIRNCLGFRGLAKIGYTIPLPEPIIGHDTYFSRGRLHPEMLYGTHWANKPGGPWKEPGGNMDNSPYEYRIKLLHWPWRARMARGWRILILPYLLDWSNDWAEFSGTVDPNYDVQHGTNIGSALRWTTPIDPCYNYYNLETVVAFKRNVIIPAGTLTFCAVPLYDPDLLASQQQNC